MHYGLKDVAGSALRASAEKSSDGRLGVILPGTVMSDPLCRVVGNHININPTRVKDAFSDRS